MRFRAAAAPLTAVLVMAVAVPGVAVAAPSDRVLTASSTTAAVQHMPAVVNVKLAPGLTSIPGIDLEAAFTDVTDSALASWFTATVTPGTEDTLVRTLSALPGVELAERAPIHLPAYEPNDPRRGDQWHLDRVRATTGWNVERGNTGVRVGVIDTQFDLGHPELRGVLHSIDGRQGVSTYTDGCAASTPYSEHGTLVAGVAAARTDNASGVASVGFGIGVVAAQAGMELGGMCVISSKWTSALLDMAHAGVPVVNLSFASPNTSMMERAVIRQATNLGTLVVAAAGNDGTTTPYYPAADPLVVAVGATDQADARWSRSNHGAWVDVAAPGVSLLTLCPGGYCYASGTSTAAPVVAATATLLAARNPSLQGLELRSRLLDAADAVSSRPIDPSLGYGRVRVDATLTDTAIRLYGRDRISTAAAVAREAHPVGAKDRVVSRVVLVPADSPNNAGWTVTLPAAGLLADGDTAFVMTGRNELHATAEAEISRLLDADGTILIPGSPSVGVSDAVKAQLERRYANVERIGTGSVAETAKDIAQQIVDDAGATAALIARGDTFADALSLSGPAAKKGYPLLFVGTDSVPAATCEFVQRNRELETLYIAGGTKAISPAVAAELEDCATGLLPRSIDVIRDAGKSRVDTALAIAKRHLGATAPRNVSVANGYSWPDAVTGGTLAASHGAPVLTTSGSGPLEPAVKEYLAKGATTQAFVLGGTVVVGAQAEADVARMIR